MTEHVGLQIGKYQIINRIGKGGTATVYSASQPNSEKYVAIKVLNLEQADNDDEIIRFRREAKTIAQASHPNIVKILDFGQQDDILYMVMDLLEGGSLAELITKATTPMAIDKALRLFEQIASALDYAHQQGIIHRDLKPHNVLLDQAQNAFLADFGIAKFARQSTTQMTTHVGVLLGTPSYMAPEHWQNEPVDARTDIYALGVMLFEMLVGELPFASDTLMGIMNKHIFEPPPSVISLRADVPAGISRVIDKALAKAPEQRFASVAEMALILKARATGQRMPMAATPKIQLVLQDSIEGEFSTVRIDSSEISMPVVVTSTKSDEPRPDSPQNSPSVKSQPVAVKPTHMHPTRGLVGSFLGGVLWLLVITGVAGLLNLAERADLALSFANWLPLLLIVVGLFTGLGLPFWILARANDGKSRGRLIMRSIAFFLPTAVVLVMALTIRK